MHESCQEKNLNKNSLVGKEILIPAYLGLITLAMRGHPISRDHGYCQGWGAMAVAGHRSDSKVQARLLLGSSVLVSSTSDGHFPLSEQVRHGGVEVASCAKPSLDFIA